MLCAYTAKQALALLEAPNFVSQVHQDFIHAGADVITTNSYALVPFHIGEERFHQQGEELAALAGRLARDAADAAATKGQRVLVAGSLSPIFGSYEPDKFDAKKVHQYLDVLVRGLAPYVDIWLGETLSVVAEAQAVLAAVERPSKPVWIAFTLDDSSTANKTSPRLRSGETIEDIINWTKSTTIETLLFNCCRPEFVESALRETKFALSSDQPGSDAGRPPRIGAYANSFMPRSDQYAANADISPTYKELSPIAYAQFAQEWVIDGAEVIGGCCGIGHEHIGQLSKTFKPDAK